MKTDYEILMRYDIPETFVVQKGVKEEDIIKVAYLSGLDDEGMPGIEEINIIAVRLTPIKKGKSDGGHNYKYGGRVYYVLEREPILCPMNGSRHLSRKPIECKRFDEKRYLFKNQFSTGRRKASFHRTREQAEDRLRTFIDIRLKNATKEYTYCTEYMERVAAITRGLDVPNMVREKTIQKLTEQPKRRLIQ